MADAEILLEKVGFGGALRVTAVCAATGVEVVFIAPSHAPERAIEQLAASKLAYAKAALAGSIDAKVSSGAGSGAAQDPGCLPRRRGVVV